MIPSFPFSGTSPLPVSGCSAPWAGGRRSENFASDTPGKTILAENRRDVGYNSVTFFSRFPEFSPEGRKLCRIGANFGIDRIPPRGI